MPPRKSLPKKASAKKKSAVKKATTTASKSHSAAADEDASTSQELVTADSTADKNTSGKPPVKGIPIVGIGASAGGLEAFEQFFTNAPPDTGMAFVLVQHLDPTHKSILVDLVGRYTRMKVFEVEDGMKVQPDCAYIIPPNRDMAILHGALHLIEPVAPRGQRLPIDYFFRSLAQDQQERAVAIVLSGTGTDGTLGVKAIKGEGGMVMVQSPESSRYDGMPRSALNAGVADYVLPAEEMAKQLVAFVELASGKSAKKKVSPLAATDDDLKKVFILVRNQTGHDFSLYKDNTIMRRIERRMNVNSISELRYYVRFMQQNPMEIDILFKELLIGVTNFFRDEDAFEALKNKVIPMIFMDRPRDQPVRVWVPGCSTGEEAYSIAILLREYMKNQTLDYDVQVFATDIDNEAIEVARQGSYPDNIAADVPVEYLKRYFVRVDNTLQVDQTIRDMMVFATQSITKDPPFSKLDLISCRNVLIYMGGELQKRVIPLFHYALNREGFLFLGHSESLGDSSQLFETIDRKWKVFRAKGDIPPTMPRIYFSSPQTELASTNFRVTSTVNGERLSYRDLVEKMLLRDHTPAAVLVDENNNVLFVHGSTGGYLEPAQGEANLNLPAMARQGLKLDITTALRKSRNQKKDMLVEGIHVGRGKEAILVDLAVHAVTEPAALRGLMLVLFSRRDLPEPTKDGEGQPVFSGLSTDERVRELEQELEATQEHLQTTIEELETSNEELTSTNEELQSSNEELQSTNEELETSKEELQSVNEELMTVNSELETKVHELSSANNDMNNLLSATEIGTLFLDTDLNIKRFTPSVTSVIKLIQTDLGRPLSDIAYKLNGIDLSERSAKVLETLIPYEEEVHANGKYFQLRILPYRTTRNIIDGVVITFVNISGQRQAEQMLKQYMEHSPVATVISDKNGLIQVTNPRVEMLLGWSSTELVGRPVEMLIPEALREGHRQTREKYMESPHPIQVREGKPVSCLRKDGSMMNVTIGLAPLNADDHVYVMANIQKASDE